MDKLLKDAIYIYILCGGWEDQLTSDLGKRKIKTLMISKYHLLGLVEYLKRYL